VTVAVVSYIPSLSGYYAESLDVLKACLESIWENTPLPHDLLVFDNASCEEVRQFLLDAQRQGRIQTLVLSDKNVGKGGAWNLIFQGAPGEIVAYTDSDVYHAPGWLEASLALLERFPQAGMITSRPLRTPERFFTATLEWARGTPGVHLEQGNFMSWEAYKEHTDSLGAAEETSRQRYDESRDWKIERDGLCAYAGAAHFQFVAPKAALLRVTPFQMDRPMGQVRSLDVKLNEAGYLRLSTCQTYVRHLGNRLPEGSPTTSRAAATKPRQKPRLSRRIANLPLIRRALRRVYDGIFRLLFEGR